MSKISKQSVLDLMQKNNFDVCEEANKIIRWIQDYFTDGADGRPAIIGMSGGKDSLVVAGLCVAALGPERVIGVMMPNGEQRDIADAMRAIQFLGINSIKVNIAPIIAAQNEAFVKTGYKDFKQWNNIVLFNNPARVRMTILYMIANQIGGRVANTCNMSETYVGYDTRWGDQCGDFAPIKNFTVTEVRAIGEFLELPKDLVNKTPDDGMCGVSDEQRYGFTYEELDYYLRGGESDARLVETVEKMHSTSQWKRDAIYLPGPDYFPSSH